jgi:tetratricopeptide (TPR) repeat protein
MPPPSTESVIARLQERIAALPDQSDLHVQLGTAYLQRARETGASSYYGQAEQAFNNALDLKPDSPQAMVGLAMLSMSNHQFSQAMEWGNRALALDPRLPSAHGVVGDAHAELGEYDAAVRSIQAMIDLKPDRDSYSRVSYMRELHGDVQGAISAMENAVMSGAQVGESAAWTLVHLGNLYFSSGRLDQAQREYEAALQALPDYHLALAALGMLHAVQGESARAISLLERSVAIYPQPGLYSLLGHLYEKVGNAAAAEAQYVAVDAIAKLQPPETSLYNRDLVLYYADRNVHLDAALERARAEASRRNDVYTLDALAWALYKNRILEKAAEAAAGALRLGTQDPLLLYHAGMVYAALGDHERSRDLLGRALALNPRFSFLHAEEAAETLRQLTGTPTTP